MSRSTQRLHHYRIGLALHELRSATGDGRPLLLLHGLGEASPAQSPAVFADWRGAVFALDFTGHGASDLPVGGGYSAEILMGDVDTALKELGEATVVGRGLGGYIALLIAGARPRLVRGAAICDGPGIFGGGVGPNSTAVITAPLARPTAPDPWALFELSRDVRPPDYATMFVRMAAERSGLREPIAVCARVRPPWLAAVADEMGVRECTLADALDAFA
jgi:pimeloyl-ACP methyl ester carboxylesterase